MNSTHKEWSGNKSWTSFLYFERNTKLINQGNYVNIVYFDFCKATNKTKKMTRVRDV